MYSRLYERIPDVSAYLERIGAKPCETPTKEYLDELIWLHQTHIPFETLDMTEYKVPISLATEDLFRKIVTEKRGGFCYELNGLFYHLLRECGYEVFETKTRVWQDDVYSGHIPPANHRIAIVKLDGKYYKCDVAMGGPSPRGALLIEDGHEEVSGGMRFKIRKVDDYWWMESIYKNGKWKDMNEFALVPHDLADFAPVAEYYATSPMSKFAMNRIVNMLTEKGHKYIWHDTYTTVENGEKVERELKDRDELNEVLRKEFHIKVPE